jgi:hypothetical protein
MTHPRRSPIYSIQIQNERLKSNVIGTNLNLIYNNINE